MSTQNIWFPGDDTSYLDLYAYKNILKAPFSPKTGILLSKKDLIK